MATNLLIEGRLVCGHPLKRRLVTKDDPVTRKPVPVMDPTTGQQKTEAYIAVAIPKAGEADWKQTPWGQQIAAQAAADWPNGEHGAATFAWKITDGDSAVPNKVGKVPNTREGWPGHWVLHMTTQFALECYNPGAYNPMTDQITDENAIKTGDYCRVGLSVRGNNPSQSPGVYLNPSKFELSRAGEVIASESGPSAADFFGGGAPATAGAATPPPPAGAATPPPPGGAVQPAPDFLSPGAGAATPPPPPVEKFLYNGVAYTRDQLAGWTEEQINALPRA